MLVRRQRRTRTSRSHIRYLGCRRHRSGSRRRTRPDRGSSARARRPGNPQHPHSRRGISRSRRGVLRLQRRGERADRRPDALGMNMSRIMSGRQMSSSRADIEARFTADMDSARDAMIGSSRSMHKPQREPSAPSPRTYVETTEFRSSPLPGWPLLALSASIPASRRYSSCSTRPAQPESSPRRSPNLPPSASRQRGRGESTSTPNSRTNKNAAPTQLERVGVAPVRGGGCSGIASLQPLRHAERTGDPAAACVGQWKSSSGSPAAGNAMSTRGVCATEVAVEPSTTAMRSASMIICVCFVVWYAAASIADC